MPVLNPDYTDKKLFSSEFFCPNCFVTRPYELAPVSKNSTFHPIPFSESDKASHVVVCEVCKNGFNPKILRQYFQMLFKLAGVVKRQLLTSESPGSLKLKLMSDGLKEEFVDKLITLALS